MLRWRLIIPGVVAFMLGLAVGGLVWWPDLRPLEPGVWPRELLSPPCGEAQHPDASRPKWTLRREAGPDGNPAPNRVVELRAQQLDDGGVQVWAAFTKSTNELDRIWLDWTYRVDYADNSQLRQCGPQPVTWSAETPAVAKDDPQQQPRWFRACGQVPPRDRVPGQSGLICTEWARP